MRRNCGALVAWGLTACLVASQAAAQPASTQPFNRERAQGAMLMRVQKVTDEYAAALGLAPSVVSYCHTKLRLDTRHEADGSIPYGFNYRTSADEQVQLTLDVREAFETTYLKLCLADVKAKLSSAR
jgi:hypothetical protein